jgi:hypothetical protein
MSTPLHLLPRKRPSPPGSRKSRPDPRTGGRAPGHEEVRHQPHQEQCREHPLLDSRALCASHRLATLPGTPPSSKEPWPVSPAALRWADLERQGETGADKEAELAEAGGDAGAPSLSRSRRESWFMGMEAPAAGGRAYEGRSREASGRLTTNQRSRQHPSAPGQTGNAGVPPAFFLRSRRRRRSRPPRVEPG